MIKLIILLDPSTRFRNSQGNFNQRLPKDFESEKLQDRPQALQDRIFERLFAAAEIARFTPQEREAYEESPKYYRDLKNVVDTSWEEGKAEGLAEGMEKGMEKGMLTVARQMKAEGLPIEQIMRFTGLSRAEIEGL